MKRFRFRLEQVLRVRRIEEDRAKVALLEANRAAHDAAVAVEERLAEYATRSFPSGPHSYAEFERTLFLLDAAAGAVDLARINHRAALDVVAQRRAEWLATRQRVDALERLESRRRDEYAVELRRAEDLLVDDLVVARHARKGAA
jgi:flagellar protein FliJ